MQEKADQFNKIYGEVGATRQEADQIAAWMNDRYYWGNVLAELRRVLIRAENDVQKKLSAERPGVQAGIWIEQLTSLAPTESANTPGRPPSAGGPPIGLQQWSPIRTRHGEYNADLKPIK